MKKARRAHLLLFAAPHLKDRRSQSSSFLAHGNHSNNGAKESMMVTAFIVMFPKYRIS